MSIFMSFIVDFGNLIPIMTSLLIKRISQGMKVTRSPEK